MGVALLRSTSILVTLILPAYSVASSSTIGAMARQGPHQAAQKSTNTGVSDFRTSWSKFESVTSTIPFPAIVPPTPKTIDCVATIVAPLLDAISTGRSQKGSCQLSAVSRQLNLCVQGVSCKLRCFEVRSAISGANPKAAKASLQTDR